VINTLKVRCDVSKKSARQRMSYFVYLSPIKLANTRPRASDTRLGLSLRSLSYARPLLRRGTTTRSCKSAVRRRKMP
jgi:hypothetical protein